LQWTRGLRAGLAVATAMTVCHLLHRPMGWAALGGFETILVDNGGPYRTRLTTMATLWVGGAAACFVAAVTTDPLVLACVAAVVFCFATTFARVLSQPIASTSVIILVIYFAGVGAGSHTFAGAAVGAMDFVFGGAWAAALSLVLWPVDPFRPARLSVAECYRELAGFTAGMLPTAPHSDEREAMRGRTHTFQRTVRLKMEAARFALGTTAVRSTSRTVRARNLTVLLETADILFAETLRWTELLERASEETSQAALSEAIHWLSGAERAVVSGLQHRPADAGASYAPGGSHSMEFVRGRAAIAAETAASERPLLAHLGADERDVLQNIEIAFEAVRAVWSGMEARAAKLLPTSAASEQSAGRWLEALRANWTLDSVMMRHSLRVALVAGIDVALMRMTHVSHGSWLAMTSIIVLQPYGSGTLRKGVQRVGGTIAGGILAAALAASIHSQTGVIVVITITSVMTLATYAVDYAWYSFFLTPTFVLMSLPHLRDWHYAGVRMGTTVLGAAVAVLAMRLLWPQREEVQLGRLLGRAASADAEYVRAVLRYWAEVNDAPGQAERTVLAPARRDAGLRILDAEETLDRLMLEPGFGRKNAAGEARAEALTFITYLRRLARAATTLAAVGLASEGADLRMVALADRLDRVGGALLSGAAVEASAVGGVSETAATTVGEQQMQRMERQVGILERAAAGWNRQG
jgi:uncharacterized membrane protein YccC